MYLENEYLKIEFTSLGGEMTSLFHKKRKKQYLYQGNTKYWSGKNPTLFPMIGNTYTKKYQIKDTIYQMNNHGLIRTSHLQCINQDKNSIQFELVANEDTLKQYPFFFQYIIKYELVKEKVVIRYYIKNIGNDIMPFQFGLHPGFLCAHDDGDDLENYRIEFEQEECLEQMIFDPELKKAIQWETRQIRQIELSYHDILKYGTLIYKGHKSKYIDFKSKLTQIRMGIDKFPILAIWTPQEQAPFVCLEPWIGHGDLEPNSKSFFERDYTMLLKPNETFEIDYYIELIL